MDILHKMSFKTFALILLVFYTVTCSIYIFYLKMKYRPVVDNIEVENDVTIIPDEEDLKLKIGVGSGMEFLFNIDPLFVNNSSILESLNTDDVTGEPVNTTSPKLFYIEFADHNIYYQNMTRVINTSLDRFQIFLYEKQCIVVVNQLESFMNEIINATLAQISREFDSNIFLFFNQKDNVDLPLETYRGIKYYGDVEINGGLIPKGDQILLLPEPIIMPTAPTENFTENNLGVVYQDPVNNIEIFSNAKKKKPSLFKLIKNAF